MRTYRSLRLAEKYPNMRPTGRSQLLAACWYVWDLPVNDIYKASFDTQILFGGGVAVNAKVRRYPDLTFRDWGIRLRTLWEGSVRAYPEIYRRMLAEGKMRDSRIADVKLLLEEASCR